MRAHLSLNGLWKFCPAFDEISADQRWMDPGFDPTNPNVTPKTGMDMGWINPGFDDEGWMDIPVPASWNAAIEDLWSYEGHGWYRRQVMVPAEWEGRRVEFTSEGANYRTVLYVNGKMAGEHNGGYTPFAIPVHRLLNYGETNTIAVACDNLPKPNRCPGGQFDWWNHGGLYRDVALHVTDTTYIDDATVVTEVHGGRAVVTVDVVVRSEEAGTVACLVEALLTDPAGEAVALPPDAQSRALTLANGTGSVKLTFVVEPALLWSPETPHLYTLTLSLRERTSAQPGDVWSHRIGLRQITVEGPKLLLNGKPLLVKGANTYEDYPVHGRSHDEAALAQDLDLLKWLGGNAFRSHIPGHRRRYELSDERGVLQLVELPLYQWGRPLVQTDNADALVEAKRQLEEIIRALKNHPCVFMWSVSNENLVKPRSDNPKDIALAKQTADGNKELVALAKRLDPTRPVVEVSNCWPGDPVHEVTDVTAPNIYLGIKTPEAKSVPSWVENMHKRLDLLRNELPDKPIMAGELGSWCVRGLMTEYFPGELYQAAFLKGAWEALLREPNFVGGFIWCFADYDVHRRFLWIYEYRCAYGLFDYHRRPKRSAYAMRKLWTK